MRRSSDNFLLCLASQNLTYKLWVDGTPIDKMLRHRATTQLPMLHSSMCAPKISKIWNRSLAWDYGIFRQGWTGSETVLLTCNESVEWS